MISKGLFTVVRARRAAVLLVAAAGQVFIEARSPSG
jgi:hypothetical protein